MALVAAGAAAAGAMERALVSHDFSLVYVADNGSRATPLLYTAAALWGALEGSILLWALAGRHLVAMARRFQGRDADPAAPGVPPRRGQPAGPPAPVPAPPAGQQRRP